MVAKSNKIKDRARGRHAGFTVSSRVQKAVAVLDCTLAGDTRTKYGTDVKTVPQSHTDPATKDISLTFMRGLSTNTARTMSN